MTMSKKHLKHIAYKIGNMPYSDFQQYMLTSGLPKGMFKFLRTTYNYAYTSGIEQDVIRLLTRR